MTMSFVAYQSISGRIVHSGQAYAFRPTVGYRLASPLPSFAPARISNPIRRHFYRRATAVSVMQTSTENDETQGIEDELVTLLPKLKVRALYLTRSADKADDLLQRTCLRALSRSHQWQAGTRLDRWVSTIMDSIWFNELRQRRQRQEQELVEPDLVADSGFEHQVEAQLMVSDLRRACSKLSDEDFALVTKIHSYGYTYREVADELGVPIGTVLSRVSRAKAMIKSAADDLKKGAGS